MTAVLHQIASSALLLLFGVLALRVWRRFGPVRRDRTALAWAVTAANFLVVGIYATTHSLISAAAFAAGEGSGLYGWVSGWALPANLGRCIASVVFGILLLGALGVSRRSAPRIATAAPAVLAAAALAGTVGVRLVPGTTTSELVITMAVLNAATAVVLMMALLMAAHNDGMDQLLWLALSVYALKETLSVSLLAVLAWWTPAYVATYYTIFLWLQVILTGVMAGLAARRLHLASGGRRVPAVFERLHALRRPAHG